MRHFLVHDVRDNVGVAVVDIATGQSLAGVSLDGAKEFALAARQEIPLGHKIALKDLRVGDTAIKYGESIGRVVADIAAGERVHIHNLKTKRW